MLLWLCSLPNLVINDYVKHDRVKIFNAPSAQWGRPWSSWSTLDDSIASSAFLMTSFSLLSQELLLHQTWWNSLLSILTKNNNDHLLSKSKRPPALKLETEWRLQWRAVIKQTRGPRWGESNCDFYPAVISWACWRWVVFVWSNSGYKCTSYCHL